MEVDLGEHKASLAMKASTINSSREDSKVDSHLAIYSRNLRSSSEVVASSKEVLEEHSNKLRAKTLL